MIALEEVHFVQYSLLNDGIRSVKLGGQLADNLLVACGVQDMQARLELCCLFKQTEYNK